MAKNKNDGFTRIERAAMAHALREQGHTRKEMEEILGISRTYLSSLFSDPDGAKDKARKERYRAICVDCGGKTSPASPGQPILRCQSCAKIYHSEVMTLWTAERIIAAIQEWDRIYGEPPKSGQWLRGKWGDGTKGSRKWPPVACVQREFGSWSNGLEAAGFERRINYERTDEWKAKVTKWSKEEVLVKLKEWAERNGRAPLLRDWRYTSGEWPTEAHVRRYFGTWNNGIRAAGLRPYTRPLRSERALVEFEDALLHTNGNKSKVEIPSFESRGEGKSLLDVVDDLREGR